MTSTNLSDTDVIRRAAELVCYDVTFDSVKMCGKWYLAEELLNHTDALLELVYAIGCQFKMSVAPVSKYLQVDTKTEKSPYRGWIFKEIESPVEAFRAALLALLRQVVGEKMGDDTEIIPLDFKYKAKAKARKVRRIEP